MDEPGRGRREIDAWLTEYTDEERRLLRHYKATGTLLSLNRAARLDQNLLSEMDIPMERLPEPDSALHQVLTEAMMIGRYADVAIVKHPRYLARFDHSHTFFEVSYVVSGGCRHAVMDGSSTEHIELTQGNVLILSPHVAHNILVDDDSVVVNILLRRSTFDRAFLHNIPAGSVLSDFFTKILYSDSHASYILFPAAGSAAVREAFYSLLEEYRRHSLYASNIMNLSLGLFFLHLLREGGDRVRLPAGYRKEAGCIPAVIHHMEEHYASTSVSELARRFNYDLSHLSRLYRKHTGTTLRESLRNIRLRHAAGLLEESGLSVDDIAMTVGYQDTSSFIRRFRQCYEVTPLQYRKQYRQTYTDRKGREQ